MTAMHGAKVLFGMALRPFYAGDKKLASHQLSAPAKMQVESAVFGKGAAIPKKYSGEGQDVSPALRWTGVPVAAVEMVLVCEDPDAPFPQPFLHWLAWGISPASEELPEGVPGLKEPAVSGTGGMRQAENSGGRIGYMGPMPPLGHGVHHYHFQLFAVDRRLELGDKAGKGEVLEAMKGHVIAEGELVGTYERR